MEIKWKRRLSYLNIGLFFFMGGIEYAVILPTLWLYLKTDFDAEEYQLGLLLSAFSFAAVITAPFLGRCSDRTRRPKILLVCGVLCEVVGNLMYFMGISVWFLLASRLVAGIGGGSEAVIMAEVTRYTDEDKRTGVISVLVAIRQAGLLLGPGLNLFLREMNFSFASFTVNKYNVPGLFMACVWLLQMLILIFLYTDLHKLQQRDNATVSKSSVSRTSDVHHHDNGHDRKIYSYDEEMSKEVSEDDSNKDVRSISLTSSGEIDATENFANEGLTSLTPILATRARSSELDAMSHSSDITLNGQIKNTTSSTVKRKDYGATNSPASYQSTDYSIQSSQEHIAGSEGHVDYLHGQSKMRFMYHEYVREEIITLLAIQFNSYFNQVALETMVTPLSDKLLNWGELENSIMYCLAGVEIICVFLFVKWLSKKTEDRSMILIGSILLTAANCWLISVIPLAKEHEPKENLWKFIIGCALDMFALPFLVASSISLYSKVTKKEIQGFSMGLRRSVVGLATILGPLWAGSTINRLYLMFGAMLGLLLMSLLMLVCSFSKLHPSNKIPVSQAGLITSSESDDGSSRPLLS